MSIMIRGIIAIHNQFINVGCIYVRTYVVREGVGWNNNLAVADSCPLIPAEFWAGKALMIQIRCKHVLRNFGGGTEDGRHDNNGDDIECP